VLYEPKNFIFLRRNNRMSKELEKIIDELIKVEGDLSNMAMATALAVAEKKSKGACESEMETISTYSKGYVEAIQYAFDKIRSVLDPYLEDELEEEKEVKEES
jgi:hypothetical protein